MSYSSHHPSYHSQAGPSTGNSQTSQRKAAGRAILVVNPLPSSWARHFSPTSQLPPDKIREFPGEPPYLIVYSHLPSYQQGRVVCEHFSKPLSEIGSPWHLHQAFGRPHVRRAVGL